MASNTCFQCIFIIVILIVKWQVLHLNSEIIKLNSLGLELCKISLLTFLEALDKHHQ
jgi:hypothetical protein